MFGSVCLAASQYTNVEMLMKWTREQVRWLLSGILLTEIFGVSQSGSAVVLGSRVCTEQQG